MNFIEFEIEKIVKDFCDENGNYEYEKTDNSIKMKIKKGRYRGRYTEFIFPSKIMLRPSTLGLIIGEGYADNSQFVFGNSNEKIIELVLEFLSQFKIALDYTVEVCVKNMDNSFLSESIKKWERAFSIKINRNRIRTEFRNTTEKGTLHIRCFNSCFSRILQCIFKKAKILVEENQDMTKDYLRGIIAAEGNINVKSTTTKCLYMVRISAKRKDERDHYKRCLDNIGIKIHCKDMPTINKNDEKTRYWKTKKGRAGAVLINRWMNFYKILSMDLLDIHKDKKRKFIEHFLNNKTTKWLLEFRKISNGWITAKELMDRFGLKTYPGIRIDKMLFLGFLEKKKIRAISRYPRYAYRLTNKYHEFISKLSQDAPSINS